MVSQPAREQPRFRIVLPWGEISAGARSLQGEKEGKGRSGSQGVLCQPGAGYILLTHGNGTPANPLLCCKLTSVPSGVRNLVAFCEPHSLKKGQGGGRKKRS